MGTFFDVQEFVRQANRVTRFEELQDLTHGIANTFGLDYYALVHHVDLNTPPEETFVLSNYPQSWEELILERRYFDDDPVHAACKIKPAGFTWAEVPDLITMTPRQREILTLARGEGLGAGFTMPVCAPGEYAGSCSFGTRFGREIREDFISALQSVGCFAFEAARRLTASPYSQVRSNKKPRLTTRQMDCVILAAQGKSDRDAAQILGISRDTVHQHIEMAKKRYDVATRTQLVVHVAYDNQLTFKDLMGRTNAGPMTLNTNASGIVHTSLRSGISPN